MGNILKGIMGVVVADRAYIGLSTQFELDERESCNMRDGKNISQAATGKLMYHKNKKVGSPFHSGVALMNLATKGTTHFRYGTRINNIHKIS